MARSGQPDGSVPPAEPTRAAENPGPRADEPLDPAEIARWSAHLRLGTLPQRVRRLRWALYLVGSIALLVLAGVVVGLLVRTSRDSLTRVEQAVHEQRRLAPAETDDGAD